RRGEGESGERAEARCGRGIDPQLVGELLGVFAPPLAETRRPEVAGDRRNGGAPLERDRPLQVVSGDRLVEGERLDARAGLVPRVVRAEVEDPGPAAVIRARVPRAEDLALAARRIGPEDAARPRHAPAAAPRRRLR